MIESHLVDSLVEYDDSALKWKIGLVSLSTDITVENDFHAMRPAPEMGFFVNRVEFINPTTHQNLIAMQPRISEAARLILPGIDLNSIAYACTSASAAIGDENVKDAMNQGKPGTPCVTPTSGAIAGFKRLGVNKISLIAPYIKSVSEELAQYFTSLGLEIISLHYMGIEDDRDIARVSHQSIIECAKLAAKTNSDGQFYSCTALPAVAILKELEALTGKPAVSSNQAMFWHAIRSAGYDQPISQYGKLLELS